MVAENVMKLSAQEANCFDHTHSAHRHHHYRRGRCRRHRRRRYDVMCVSVSCRVAVAVGGIGGDTNLPLVMMGNKRWVKW